MPRAPQPNQKRYRGRIRHVMRSALHHLQLLGKQDTTYHGKPITYYPNQLAPTIDMVQIATAAATITAWLGAKGPIPSR